MPVAQTDLHEPWERVGRDADSARSRIQHQLDRLRQQQALVRQAVEETYDETWRALDRFGSAVEHGFRLIELELDIASAAEAGRLAGDAATFGDALAAEVRAWDLYAERLQARAAPMPDAQRADAEEALRGLRRHRNALAQLVDDTRDAPATWRERRSEADEVRRALEHAVDEITTGFG